MSCRLPHSFAAFHSDADPHREAPAEWFANLHRVNCLLCSQTVLALSSSSIQNSRHGLVFQNATAPALFPVCVVAEHGADSGYSRLRSDARAPQDRPPGCPRLLSAASPASGIPRFSIASHHLPSVARRRVSSPRTDATCLPCGLHAHAQGPQLNRWPSVPPPVPDARQPRSPPQSGALPLQRRLPP